MTEIQKRLEAYYRTCLARVNFTMSDVQNSGLLLRLRRPALSLYLTRLRLYPQCFLIYRIGVAGYYGTVRNRIGGQLFRLDHRDIAYYTSAIALYKLERYFRTRSIDPKYRPLRWYLLMLLRYQLAVKMYRYLIARRLTNTVGQLSMSFLTARKHSQLTEKLFERLRNTVYLKSTRRA